MVVFHQSLLEKSRSFECQGKGYVILRSYQDQMTKSIFNPFKSFCDLCVMWMVQLRLKGILVFLIFTLCNICVTNTQDDAFVNTHPHINTHFFSQEHGNITTTQNVTTVVVFARRFHKNTPSINVVFTLVWAFATGQISL